MVANENNDCGLKGERPGVSRLVNSVFSFQCSVFSLRISERGAKGERSRRGGLVKRLRIEMKCGVRNAE